MTYNDLLFTHIPGMCLTPMVPDIVHNPVAIGFFYISYVNMTIDGFFSMIYKQYMEIFPSILTDKLTVSYAPGQLIGGGCFAAVQHSIEEAG